MSPNPGDPAPDFALASDRGGTVRLSDLSGSRVLLVFYPQDDTPGCTRQACALRDDWPEVEATGALVFGISPDDVASHVRFRDKFSLPFPLLADTGRTVAVAYGVMEGERLIRSSFLIEADGTIGRAWRKVNPDDHLQIVLQALAT